MDKPPKGAKPQPTPRPKTATELLADEIGRQAIDAGVLIELGFTSLVAEAWAGLPKDSQQYQDLRCAFFAGAQHLFGTIANVLDPDSPDATTRDLARMASISDELDRFIREFEALRLQAGADRGRMN